MLVKPPLAKVRSFNVTGVCYGLTRPVLRTMYIVLPVSPKYNWYCKLCYNSCFPNFIPSRDITSGKWGILSGHNIRESLENAYNSVIAWKPNLFRLPSGSVGKEFVEEITSIVNHFIKNTEMQSVAMSSTELGDRSSLDVGARGLWSGLEKTLFDVRIFHPGAQSYQNRSLESIYKTHEKEKKDKYLNHVLNNEKCTFTPLVFSTHGGSGLEAQRFHKRLASLIAKKRNIPYSDAVSYVRRRVRFSILRTTLIALRGYRGKESKKVDLGEEDLNLIPTTSRYEHLV